MTTREAACTMLFVPAFSQGSCVLTIHFLFQGLTMVALSADGANKVRKKTTTMGHMLLDKEPHRSRKEKIDTYFTCWKGNAEGVAAPPAKCQEIPQFCHGVADAGMATALGVLGKYMSEMSSMSPSARVAAAKELQADNFKVLSDAIPDEWAYRNHALAHGGGSDSSILNRAASQDGVGGVEHKEGEGGDSTSYDSSAHLTSVLGRAAGSKSLMFKVSLYHALCL